MRNHENDKKSRNREEDVRNQQEQKTTYIPNAQAAGDGALERSQDTTIPRNREEEQRLADETIY